MLADNLAVRVPLSADIGNIALSNCSEVKRERISQSEEKEEETLSPSA